MADIKFEIKEEIGILSTSPSGWNKELNLYHLGDPFLISAVKQIQIELADRELPFWTVRCSP